MTYGTRIWGPDSTLWFDMDNMTSRVVGSFIATSSYTSSDTFDVNGWHRAYPCPPNTTPWAICIPIDEAAGYAVASRIDADNATLNYALPAFQNNGQIIFAYGYAQ